jgi:hypothetical protein
MLRTYRLTSTTTSGGAGAAGVSLTTVLAKGRIVGVRWNYIVNAGAGDGSYRVELALNNPTLSYASAASGAPSESLVSRIFAVIDNTSPVNVCENGYHPTNIPIVPGNTLCINQDQSGTAATSCWFGFDVLVEE